MARDKVGGGSGKRGGRKAATTTSRSQPFPHKRPGNASTDPSRPLPASKKAGFYRDKAKINLLRMYNAKPEKRSRAARKQQPTEPARVEPDRRWFGNTRVITQSRLEQFREAMEKARKNPYSVILKRAKLPSSLFQDDTNTEEGSGRKRKAGESGARSRLLSIESFEKTFGPRQSRKRPRQVAACLSSVLEKATKKQEVYAESQDRLLIREETASTRDATEDAIFKKGTSRRIWQELYKVVDSSDVIVQVIDARDPMGTRCTQLEQHIRKDKPNKYVVLLLNKCDLIPAWCTSRWVKLLSAEYPTIAFHSSLKKSFGKMTLVNLLRQYAKLLKNRKHVSVGFIGYPNVGKSSVINTLRKKDVCKAAPMPGETKIWQYIALTHRIYLIDCPGVVPGDQEAGSESDKLLKGVVRAERIESPENHIQALMDRVPPAILAKHYRMSEADVEGGAEVFLEVLARKTGRLLPGGDPDISTAARSVLYDWQRGSIPHFTPPPGTEQEYEESEADDSDDGEQEESDNHSDKENESADPKATGVPDTAAPDSSPSAETPPEDTPAA